MISPANYEKMEAQRPPVAVNNRGPTDTENGGIGVAEGTHTKTCKVCGLEKPLDEFNKHPTTRDRRNIYCKPCHRERAKTWQRGVGKAKHADAVKRWKRTDVGRASGRKIAAREYAERPERRRARNELNDAIREGRIIRPDRCQGCGAEGPVQGHHWSYEREHWLDVTWLCSRCHTAIHRAMTSPRSRCGEARDLGGHPEAVA